MNVFDYAMQLELDGKAYYEKLAQTTPVVRLANIFSVLAADEQKHHDVVMELKAGVIPEMADSSALENAKNIFLTLRVGKNNIDKMRSKLDVYRHAMDIEAESVRLYEGAARKESRLATAQLLQLIAEEEKKHYNIMENIYYLISRHASCTNWQDFSRIRNL